MKLILFGDGAWAAESLERLLDEGHTALAVVLRRHPSDGTLGEFAKQRNIPVCAPERVNAPEFVHWVGSQGPELNVSVSYDQILRGPIISSAPLGFINVHAGKLPFYRGCNVINWAIINDERELGLTVHYVDEGIDTGEIIIQRTLPIDLEDTYATVLTNARLAMPGLLMKAINLLENNDVVPLAQTKIGSTYFSKRVNGDEWIDWNDTSLNIYNKIRAITHPGPGARTLLARTGSDYRTMIIWKTRYNPSAPVYMATPGEVVGIIPEEGVMVKTGDSTILLEAAQFHGQVEPEFVPAFRIGTRFGMDLPSTVMDLQKQVAELSKMVIELRRSNAVSLADLQPEIK